MNNEIKHDDASRSGKVRSGKARMGKLSPEERKALAKHAASERWRKVRENEAVEMSQVAPGKYARTDDISDDLNTSIHNTLPVAKWPGQLDIGIACYVLDDGRREAHCPKLIATCGCTQVP